MAYDEATYRLWWEFLKRSDRYKRICDVMYKRRRRRQTPDAVLFELFPEARDIELSRENLNLFNECCAFATYRRFGDVHRSDFESWWNAGRMFSPVNRAIPANNYEVIEDWVLESPDSVRAVRITFNIDLADGLTANVKSIHGQVKEIMKLYSENVMSEIVADTLVRYLEIYDIWSAHAADPHWTDRVIEQHDYYRRQWQNSRTSGESIKVTIARDCRYAQEIVMNAATGRFPLYKRYRSS